MCSNLQYPVTLGFSCWSDEDYIGRISRVSRKVHGTSITLAFSTLRKSLIQYRAEWSRGYGSKLLSIRLIPKRSVMNRMWCGCCTVCAADLWGEFRGNIKTNVLLENEQKLKRTQNSVQRKLQVYKYSDKTTCMDPYPLWTK